MRFLPAACLCCGFSCGFGFAAAARAAAPNCPPALMAEQTASPPAGLTLYHDGNPPAAGTVVATFKLQSAMVSDGPPEQQGWLVPDDDQAMLMVWNIKADGDQNAWLTCSYAGTPLWLSAPLPPGTVSCRWSVGKAKTGMIVCS